ncbi:MAG TPA: archaetidylserine decarboxylase [Longimicrobiaceae bacterium]|nr:archaetidylserine decarboxylase [Longimicrobiaceae bacterium]
MTPPADETPDLPGRRARALLGVLRRLPQGALSRAFGRAADLPLPRPLRRPVLGSFARFVGADVSEAAAPLESFPTLNRFFTRELKPGARNWPHDPRVAACPVDGVAGQVGRVTEGKLIQAKGRAYSLRDLLDDGGEWERFDGGAFATLYLSPRDYHRIHSPCDGAIPRARHVPGALLPVNLPAVAHLADLFARNERLLCYVDGPLGRVAVVAVGAYNVGRISAAFDPEWNAASGKDGWVTNRSGVAAETKVYAPPVPVAQGDEIMTFHLGSTVVLVFEPGRVELVPALKSAAPVRLGMPIGRAPPEGLLGYQDP